MANPSKAAAEKNLVWQQVELILGKLSTPTRSDGWKISQDNSVSVFVTFSQIYKESKTAWYDINIHKLQKWLQYPQAYIIFVVGNYQNSFIIPAKIIKDEIDKSSRQITDSDNFVIHIKNDLTFHITEFKLFNLMNYHLAYQSLQGTTPSVNTRIIKEASQKYEAEEPEDVQPGQIYYEGALTQVTVNIYERNTSARRVCIQHYGAKCFICGFDFKKIYGEMGDGFIHVHHIKPLSEIGGGYTLDPIKDLRPVCPNCHAMLHRRKPAFSIEDIQKAIGQRTTKTD